MPQRKLAVDVKFHTLGSLVKWSIQEFERAFGAKLHVFVASCFTTTKEASANGHKKQSELIADLQHVL